MEEPEHDLLEALEELVIEGDVEEGTPAHGIALQVAHDGYDSLSRKQKFIYDEHVAPAMTRKFEEWRMNQIMNSAPD